jgi:hypothetical protein
MALPEVARTSPSRAFTGLQHAKSFSVTVETGPPRMVYPAVFFRTCGANPQLDGAKNLGDRITKNPKPDLKPNGKHDDSSKKPCADFNAGRPSCKKLKPDGTCVFAHRCNQFVSDKGLGGYCLGAHARCTGCDYDATNKLRAPAA